MFALFFSSGLLVRSFHEVIRRLVVVYDTAMLKSKLSAEVEVRPEYPLSVVVQPKLMDGIDILWVVLQVR